MNCRRWKLSSLTRVLSELHTFSRQEPSLEQVATPPEEAAQLLWEGQTRGDISGKTVLDLGCGTGVLAIGAALLGAQGVVGIDVDEAALGIAERNAADQGVDVHWIRAQIQDLSPRPCDTVVMNPPFGVQKHGALRPFLEFGAASVRSGGALYLFAGPGSQRLIEKVALGQTIRVEEHIRLTWRFPAIFAFHTERRAELQVDRWVLRKTNDEEQQGIGVAGGATGHRRGDRARKGNL